MLSPEPQLSEEERAQLEAVLSSASTQAQAADSLALDDLLARCENDQQQERGLVAWLRSRPTAWRMALGVGFVAAVAGLQLIAAPRADLGSYPIARLALESILLLGLLWGGAALMLRPLHRSRPPLWLTLMVPVIGVGAPLALAWFAPPAEAAGAACPSGMGHLGCLRYGVACAVPALVLLRALDRTKLSRRAIALNAVGLVAAALVVGQVGAGLWPVDVLVWAGMAAGIGFGGHGLRSGLSGVLAGASAGLLALLLHCPMRDPSHLMIGHAALPIAMIGAWLLASVVLSFGKQTVSQNGQVTG